VLRRPATLTLVIALWLVACASGPEEGDYALVRLNDAPLPYDHELGCCVYLSGSFVLSGEEYTAAIRFRNKNTSVETTFHERGDYDYAGPRLSFAPTAADFPFSLYNGMLTDDTLRLQFGGDGPGAADQFRAVFVRHKG
jgi:hypothetical protein